MAKLPEPQVLVFVKDPERAPVKTRLAARIGPAAARAFYDACLERLVGHLATVALRGLRPILLVDPPDSVASFPARLGWRGDARPQAVGDLGVRLREAFREAGGPAMAIGSDCPEVTPGRLLEAARRLHPGRVVLGPSPDGGYYLIGLAQPEPAVFVDIPWSTSEVAEATCRAATGAGLEVERLEPLPDIDEASDLAALELRLACDDPLRGRIAAWLEDARWP